MLSRGHKKNCVDFIFIPWVLEKFICNEFKRTILSERCLNLFQIEWILSTKIKLDRMKMCAGQPRDKDQLRLSKRSVEMGSRLNAYPCDTAGQNSSWHFTSQRIGLSCLVLDKWISGSRWTSSIFSILSKLSFFPPLLQTT